MLGKKDVKNEMKTRLATFLLCILFICSLFSCDNRNIKFIPKYFDEGIKSEIIQSKECVVQIFVQKDYGEVWGSGVVISEDGIILTARHVVEDANSIQVKSNNGVYKSGQILYIDEDEDFAFIKVDSNCKFETFGEYSDVELGDWVYIIGTPIDKELFNTIIYGSVSSLDRRLGYFSEKLLLQLDANIEGGYSGGPVFNTKGEIIGIVVGKYSGTSICICTPITSIVNKFFNLPLTGRFEREKDV